MSDSPSIAIYDRILSRPEALAVCRALYTLEVGLRQNPLGNMPAEKTLTETFIAESKAVRERYSTYEVKAFGLGDEAEANKYIDPLYWYIREQRRERGGAEAVIRINGQVLNDRQATMFRSALINVKEHAFSDQFKPQVLTVPAHFATTSLWAPLRLVRGTARWGLLIGVLAGAQMADKISQKFPKHGKRIGVVVGGATAFGIVATSVTASSFMAAAMSVEGLVENLPSCGAPAYAPGFSGKFISFRKATRHNVWAIEMRTTMMFHLQIPGNNHA